MSNKNLPMNELLSTQISDEEYQHKENSSSELIIRKKITGTPFELIGSEQDETFFIAYGKYRVSDKFKTEKEAFKTLIEEQYNIITNLIVLIIGLEKEEIKAAG